jgi:membrane-associated phospholipid phosphatase
MAGLKEFLKERGSNSLLQKYGDRMLLAYSVTFLAIVLFNHIYLLPDQMLFFGLVGAFFVGRGLKFVRDWLPLVLLLFAYEAMRGLVWQVNTAVHFMEPIIAEKILFFGLLPTIELQALFFNPAAIQWYDLLAAFFYSIHFVAPLFFAFFLWTRSKSLYQKFALNLIIVSYAALITFLLFPAAPPWLASEQGFIPPVSQVLFAIHAVYPMLFLKTAYVLVNANPVAAIPSLHVSYPFLIFIFAFRHYGKRALPLAVLPLGVGLSIIYLGEHYVVDLLVGLAYVLAVYFIVEKFIFKGEENVENKEPGHRVY